MTQPDGTDRVVIAGASGFIGSRLAAALRADGAQVQTIGRRGADAVWGDDGAIRRLVDGADLLVNLAGKSVNCRYNRRNREEILRSRVETTRALGEAVRAASAPPPLWLNASTATIYRHAEDRPMTEADGELGEGFSVGIARAWEEELFRFELPATRRVALRTSIVLGRGSVLVPLRNLVRFGLGGPQLDGRWIRTPGRVRAGTFHEFSPTRGRQRFSWIHIDDVVDSVRFLRTSDLAGVVNVTSPNPSDNRTLMAALRRELGMPVGLPAFRWMLELGSVAIRTETELVLKSRWVLPQRLLEAGYRFRHPHLDETLHDLLAQEK
jgi:NAD dependent epimerase/dehydratase family enzyme